MNSGQIQNESVKKYPLTVTIIVLNEERDLPRCLQNLDFADEVLVFDSGSTDRTREIAESYGAKVFQEKWRGYGAQKNIAMDQARNDWVLNVDADEVVTPELKTEICNLLFSDGEKSRGDAYRVARKTFFGQKWIQYGGWYPNRVARLSRKSNSRWTEPDVHEKLESQGLVGDLKNPLLHFTFSDIHDQVFTNIRYAKQGSDVLKKKKSTTPLWKLILKPMGKFFECFVLKQGFRDGLVGFVIAINASYSIFLKYAFFFEEKILGRPEGERRN